MDTNFESDLLGNGAYGSVMTTTNPLVVEKIIYPYKNKDDEYQYNYGYICLNEIGLQQTLEHDNVVKINKIKYGDKGCIKLSMDTAKRILKVHNMFDLKNGKHIILDLLNALDYFDSRSIIHNDIKPENILMFVKDKDLMLKFINEKKIRQKSKIDNDEPDSLYSNITKSDSY